MREPLEHSDVSTADLAATRFLRAAQLCRARDLERLFVLGELVRSMGELIHGLQRERGASSIVLGSHGASFLEQLDAQVSACCALERDVRERLDHVDATLDGMSFGARFYTRGAMVFRALDRLTALRARVAALKIAPQEAMRAFSDIIACLLAVGFESADIAADPQISRALIALANFSQGKEYAGQERATAGAAFSRGRFGAADKQRVRQLINAQDQAFNLFREFATATHAAVFNELMNGEDTNEVKRMRRLALGRESIDEAADSVAAAWFRHSTARIDSMQTVEQDMSAELSRLCAAKLAEAREDAASASPQSTHTLHARPPVAMLISDPDSALHDLGLPGGVGLYTLDAAVPAPMHSILDVIHAQSKRLNDVSQELECARAALVERKSIERAKGLLMLNRQLTEKQAYDLMRQSAMNQNKRVYEIAEAIISMADILQPSL
jgi:AmiR/NasT family two-component response regulator